MIRSFFAFSEGGILGVGLGNSREKFLYLPEAETDFIFSIIGEELGLVGALFVIALFPRRSSGRERTRMAGIYFSSCKANVSFSPFAL